MISQKQLIELGFTEKEAKVYLALLELGPSTASEVARKAGINRTTSYDILEGLTSEGLVNLPGETKIQKFVAENPEKVISFLQQRINQAEQRLNMAQGLLPQLLSVYNTKEKPKVKFYQGVDQVKEAFEDTLTAEGELLAYAVGESMYQALPPRYFADYFKRRTLKGITVRVIAPDDEGSRAVVKNDTSELRTSILVPKDQFYFSVEMNIYSNKALFVSWQEKFAVIVESEEIANMQRKVFELAWAGAKQFRVNN
ncbi:MAG: TrmB family transcriptional regulator [Candidatus Kerfeldbacteria bacterium]|nr:TrmB family transcriptional regulator [Candidatus Kerfeldbacteria bacterium]